MSAVVGTPVDIVLTDGLNPVRFPALANQTALNLFEFEGAMIPTAGFTTILARLVEEDQEGRGIFYSDLLNACVVVLGNTLYKITLETHEKLGTLASDRGRVYFAENGLTTLPDSSTGDPGGQIAISDGINIYTFAKNGAFSKAEMDDGSALDFVPGTLAFQNGFFFANDLGSDRIYASTLNESRVWPVLFFDLVAARTRSCVAFKNLLYVFGKDKTNLFYSQPSEPQFPYAPDVSRAWDYGCLSQASVATSQGLIVWLGNTRYGAPTILMSTGGTPTGISTPGIDALIDSFETPQDAEGFMYEEDGHIFYQITFEADNITLLYDFTSKKWTGLTDTSGQNRSPVRQSAYFEGKNTLLAITRAPGRVGKFGVNIFNFDDEVIPRMIITQNYTQEERQVMCQELDLQIEQGENAVREAVYPSDPVEEYAQGSRICLSISKDRGRTYPIEHVRTLGRPGFRRELLRWRKLGAARWWTFKWDFLSKDRFVIMKATAWFQK